ncbi:MAG: DUF362 domain-containing protein [Deltaproteobacteria bacterium]|nr:DUF362 domain-containing protein [Deltaproteobacteria bacterium]
MSRRRFVQLAGGALALSSTSCLPHVGGEWETCGQEGSCEPETHEVPAPPSSRVVEVSDPLSASFESLTIEAARVPAMFRAGLLALCEVESVKAAWEAVLPAYEPGQRIGIKVNCLSARAASSLALTQAVHDSLVEAGIEPEAIFVWDRTERELGEAGFLSDEVLGPRCQYTLAKDETADCAGYECEPVCLSGRKIYLSRLLTRETDHLINLAVMKNHDTAKFTGCLKNHYGAFSRPGDFHDNCAEHIAQLNTLPAISSVSRLQVLDALLGVCKADTNKPADCAPGRVLLAFDPVAIDRRGIEIRDEQRFSCYDLPAGYPAEYLDRATELGVGAASYELVRIDMPP